MKRNLLYSILLSIVFLGCGIVSSDNNIQNEVAIKYYLCDSTGTEKTVFKIGESIFGGYVLNNLSSEPIEYITPAHKKSWFSIAIQKAWDNDIVLDEVLPPPGETMVNKVIQPGEMLAEQYEVVNKRMLYNQEPGNYKASFRLHYEFDVEIRKLIWENNVIYYKIEGDSL